MAGVRERLLSPWNKIPSLGLWNCARLPEWLNALLSSGLSVIVLTSSYFLPRFCPRTISSSNASPQAVFNTQVGSCCPPRCKVKSSQQIATSFFQALLSTYLFSVFVLIKVNTVFSCQTQKQQKHDNLSYHFKYKEVLFIFLSWFLSV